MQEMRVRSLGREDPLEKEMATGPSILAWRIPWTEEPGGLQSTGSQSRTHTHTHTHTLFESINKTGPLALTNHGGRVPACCRQSSQIVKCASLSPHRDGGAVDLGETPREVRRDYTGLQCVCFFCWRSSSKHVCENTFMSFTGQSITLFP